MQTHLNPGATSLANPARHFAACAASPRAGSGDSAPGLRPAGSLRDNEFVFLQQAYRPSGGLAHGDELAARLHVNGDGGHARLARWIVGRQVFSFGWHEHFWLPMFQFEPVELTPRDGLHPVLAELVTVMDGPALASWFADPNEALQGHSPVAMLATHKAAVHQAARMQRYVMT
jgi:hypothetical protein